VGNPIERHGDNPAGEFTLIRNGLIRGSGLAPAESVVLNILLSHEDGWEVTHDTIARDAGMTRPTVKRALAGLVAKRKLIIQAGKRGHCVFHVHPQRDFTAEEVAALGKNLDEDSMGAGKEPLRGVGKESLRGLVKNLYDKKDQGKDQEEDQANSAADERHVLDNPASQHAEEKTISQTEERHLLDSSPSQGLEEKNLSTGVSHLLDNSPSVDNSPSARKVHVLDIPTEEDERRRQERALLDFMNTGKRGLTKLANDLT
jgi:hypothetical protein